jgi:hypothetical protein
MLAASLTRPLLTGLAALALTGCQLLGPAASPVTASDLPNPGLARLAGLTQIAFAWESRPTCKLETATGDALPETSWEPLATNALAGKTLDVIGMRIHKRDSSGPVQWLAMALRDGPQSTRWVRNPPTDDDATAAQAWRCALGPAARDALLKPVALKRVRLSLGSAACTHFAPVLGGPEDLGILPYDVGETSVFAPPALAAASAKSGDLGLVMGVRLKSTTGDGQLTVRAQDLDACFEDASDVASASLDEAQALARWLDAQPPDPLQTPAVSSAALRVATGVMLRACAHDGDGPAEHYECVVPSLRVASVSSGAPGEHVLELVRDRSVDAVHAYGGRLVPATDVVTRDVLVRAKVTGGGLLAEWTKPLDASVLDRKKQASRASLGFRLMRPQDVTAVAQPTHTLDLDVAYTVPPVEQTELRKKRSFVAGTRDVPNPDLYLALRDYDRIRAELTNLMEAGGIGGEERMKVLQARLQSAREKVEALPKSTTADDTQTFSWVGNVLRRKGTAKVKATLKALDGSPGLTASFDVPFEVLDTDDAPDPAHKLVAKPARPPTPSDVDRALATALVARIDDVVGQWLLQTHLGPMAPTAMAPGSRAWGAAAARRAVNDRPIALLADWSEERPKVLAAPLVTIPVELPADSGKRCLVFTATPLAPQGDENLVFGLAPAPGSKRFVAIGRDARPEGQAAFELCGVPPGPYALGVWSSREAEPPGFLVSIFESTPGAGSDDTLRAAIAGSPSTATGEEPPSLKVGAMQ